MTEEVKVGLSKLGFFESIPGWSKISLPMIGSSDDIAQAIRNVGGCAAYEAAELAGWADLIVDQKAGAHEEFVLWPLKVAELDLPAYIIPIEPRWAAELFDEGLASGKLWGRDTSLGINTEAVYYRSCRGTTIQAPARILWYVSDDRSEPGTKAIRACSTLDEAIIAKPKELYRKFHRLGVYQWDDVYAAADHNVNQPIMAMRFSGTELFKKPLIYGTFKGELEAVGANPTMVGPVPIPAALFLKLYGNAVR